MLFTLEGVFSWLCILTCDFKWKIHFYQIYFCAKMKTTQIHCNGSHFFHCLSIFELINNQDMAFISTRSLQLLKIDKTYFLHNCLFSDCIHQSRVRQNYFYSWTLYHSSVYVIFFATLYSFFIEPNIFSSLNKCSQSNCLNAGVF